MYVIAQERLKHHVESEQRLIVPLSDGSPAASVAIARCGVLDLSVITLLPVAPDQWCRLDGDTACWFFPAIGSGEMAAAMHVSFGLVDCINKPADPVAYETDCSFGVGAVEVDTGTFRFRVDADPPTAVVDPDPPRDLWTPR